MIRPLLVTILLLATITCGQAMETHDLSEPIPGHDGKTFYDLAKAIVPDLQPNGDGKTAIALPYVEDLGEQDEDPLPEEGIHISSVEVGTLQSEGRDLTVMLAGLGQADGWATGIEALAIFDENLNLLDAINVGLDKTTWIKGEPIRISADSQAILTQSEHFNSNQTYGGYALVMIKNGRFQTIDVISTLSDRWCGHDRWEQLAITTNDNGAGYWPITATVTDELKVDTSLDCGDEIMQTAYSKTYTATYSWSASMGLYVTDGDGFDALDAFNSERY